MLFNVPQACEPACTTGLRDVLQAIKKNTHNVPIFIVLEKGSITMKSKFAEATRIVHAPAAGVYEIIADYRTQHPRILPKPYFLSLDVEEGGFGAGTIVNFKMRLLGKTQSFRSLITEPEPGKTLLETDLSSGVVTRFDVLPLENGEQTQVTITTELRNRGGVESLVAKLLLQKIYHQELELLAKLAEGPAKLIQSVTSDRTRGS